MMPTQEQTTKTNAEYYEQRCLELAKKSEPQVVQLPLWPDHERAAPNVLVRSALFGVIARSNGKRKHLKKQEMASWSGSSIAYTGERLDQYDSDVWHEVVHRFRSQNLADGQYLHFTAGSVLNAIDRRRDSGDAIRRLDDALIRMVACAVTVSVGDFEYSGALIHEVVRDKVTARYAIKLNPKIVALFESGYTRVEWQTRLGLKTDLAKWLLGYVESHKATTEHPHRVAVATLRRLTGVSRELKKFRYDLKAAIAQLADKGVIASWRITENDALEFARSRVRLLGQQTRQSRAKQPA